MPLVGFCQRRNIRLYSVQFWAVNHDLLKCWTLLGFATIQSSCGMLFVTFVMLWQFTHCMERLLWLVTVHLLSCVWRCCWNHSFFRRGSIHLEQWNCSCKVADIRLCDSANKKYLTTQQIIFKRHLKAHLFSLQCSATHALLLPYFCHLLLIAKNT